MRNDQNQLEVTDNTTEVCQYYAFYFNTATPESYPELWQTLTEQFGPDRIQNNLWPSVYPANSFVGNYLRMELLSRNNLRSQLLAESIDYFDYMAARTGTLWEMISSDASCDHGFASHVAHVLYRDVLGIADVNQTSKEITLEFSELDLDYCKGQIPIGEHIFRVEWEHYENSIYYHFECPEGYNVVIRNNANLTLVER